MPKSGEFVVGLVVFLFLFFGLFLFFFQKGNRLSKNLLGLFFLSLGLAVANVFFLLNGTYDQYPQFANWLNTLPLVYGPLIWLFTQSVVNNKFKLKRIDLLHFAPYVLAFISLIFLYHIRDIDFKREFLRRAFEEPGPAASISSIVIFVSIGVYIYFSYRSISKYRERIKEEVSNIDRINLGWLDFMLLGFVIIMVLSLFVQIAFSIFPNNTGLNLLLLILLFVLLIFIMAAIIKGLRSNVSFESKLEGNEINVSSDKKLTQDEMIKLKALQGIMETKKPFLESSLTLLDLAKQADLSSREVSYLINRGASASFFDFINRYRIQFAQDKIINSEDDKQTILEVMYSSGFNSKSSFNTAFKKHSGFTPTQWKKING